MQLHEPGSLQGLSLRNRGVFRAVRTRFTDGGVPTEELAAHLGARAAGGAGLVVGPAQMLVHPSASGPSYVDAYDDAAIDGLSTVAATVHAHDAPIIGQLTHPGAEASGDWEMQPQLAPSASPSDAAYEMPKTMDRREIEAVLDGFATAAGNLAEAGFDGVELAAGPFSVLRQFLSPRYNAREDKYGEDWAARARFVNEALGAASDRSPGPVGLHLSLAELEYGGYEFDDVPHILDEIQGYDYLSVTVGSHASFNQTYPAFAVSPPDLVEPIRTVTERVDVPVIGRLPFTGVDDAPTLFDAGVDFVSFTRQLLADEETLRKDADEERYDRCIQCNQKCLEGIYGHAHGGHVECVVNPRTGREAELSPRSSLDPAGLPQDILVVGGGPAGLRFGAIAAERGHSVTIREAEDDVGGQLKLAATGPLESLGRALEDLEAAARDSGAEIETGSPVTTDDIDPQWDAIVVATGASRPALERYDFEGEIVDAFDVLDGAAVGDDVLLFDDNRWVITAQTGLTLLDRAEDVEMVSNDHYPGFNIEQPNLPGFVAALQGRGATFTGNHTVDAVAPDGTVTLRNTLTGDTATRNPDTVVVVGRRTVNEDLYLDLKERYDGVYRVGDAISPRKLDRAYFDGERLARRL